MDNRRTFIKQLTAAGLLSAIPGAVFSNRESGRSVRLLVRADDMGITYDKTMAIIKAHKEGIVTSTSLMTASPFFEEAVQLSKENPTLAVGVHITLVASTRTRSVLPPDEVPSILTQEGFFYYDVDELSEANPKYEEMEKEVRAQVEKAREHGLHFVYIDWHKSGNPEAEASKMRKEIIVKICREQRLIFGSDWEGEIYGYKRIPFVPEHFPIHVLPDGKKFLSPPAPELSEDDKQVFYDRLNSLKPGKWLAPVHPGLSEPERASVTELMCSGETKEIIKKQNIQLVSYYDLWEEEFGKNKI
jgi:hypothetical protein